MSSELLCKHCKHATRKLTELPLWGTGSEWRCRKAFVAAKSEHDPVTGSKTIPAHLEKCLTARWRDSSCGPEGQLWEPKNKKYLFLAIKHSER